MTVTMYGSGTADSGADANVGVDWSALGEQYVKAIAERPGQQNVGLIAVADTGVGKSWLDGVKAAAAKTGNVKIVGEVYTGDDAAKALPQTSALLTAHPDINVVATHMGTVTPGAIAAIKSKGKTGSVAFLANGPDNGGKEGLASGGVWRLLVQDLCGEGADAVNAVSDKLGNKGSSASTVPFVKVGTALASKDDLQSYLSKGWDERRRPRCGTAGHPEVIRVCQRLVPRRLRRVRRRNPRDRRRQRGRQVHDHQDRHRHPPRRRGRDPHQRRATRAPPRRRDSQDHGIAAVYQDLALVEYLDISSNMALGNLPRKFRFLLDRGRMDREAAKVLTDLKVRVGDVKTPVGLLSGGQRQVVAIARAVRMDKPIVLLDEPTAALGVQESAHVGQIIDELKAAGKAVICISHDLEFVFKHADRITVLRLGHSVGTRQVQDTSRDEIISMITGLADSTLGDQR